MEGLASSEGRRELRARLEEWVEKRGAELQELFGEYGFGGWRSEAAAQRGEERCLLQPAPQPAELVRLADRGG
ncbi:MAG: hypothetical protein QW650_06195 [Thermofilum sp.]